MAQSWGLWVQASVVLTVTGPSHTQRARPGGPAGGRAEGGCFLCLVPSPSTLPQTWFSPPPDVLPWCWLAPAWGSPPLFHKATAGAGWLGVACMRIHIHSRARMLTCTSSSTCAPQLSFCEPHVPAPNLTPSPSCPTTKATGNSRLSRQRSRQCKTLRQASLSGCFKHLAGCEPRWLTAGPARENSLPLPVPLPPAVGSAEGLGGRVRDSAWCQRTKELDWRPDRSQANMV